MRPIRRDLLGAGAASAALLARTGLWPTPASARQFDPTTLARNVVMTDLARRAAVFFFPLYEMWRMRWNAILNPANPRRSRENSFAHARMLVDHRSRAVTTPNNDTLYSSAWLDLSQGPLLLSVPDTGDRYYSLAFMDAWTNNFAYVGRCLTGNRARHYFVAGPDWHGSPPEGHGLIRAPTNLVWLLGRTLVDGPEDLAAATDVMHRYMLAPSAEPRVASRLPLQATPVPPDPDDAAIFFAAVRHAWAANGASAADQPELEALAPLQALWEGGAPMASDDPRWPELREGYETARRLLRNGPSLGGGNLRNGWSVPPKALGNFGTQYGLRALVALTGLAALEPAEAMYMTANADSDGRPLSGTHRYALRFEKDAMPPVDAFWSLSMYEVTLEGRAFFTDNPCARYAVGDRSRHLRYGVDGSLDLYIQKESPGEARESNWLPAPAGAMRLTFRAYQPRAALLDGRYALPPVQRLD